MLFQILFILYFLIGLFLSIMYYMKTEFPSSSVMFFILFFWPLYFLFGKKETNNKEKDCDCE